MKKIVFMIVFFNFLILADNKKISYEVDYNIDIPITIISALIGGLPPLLTPDLPGYMKNEKLNVDDVNAFDKLTVYNYNETSAKASDYLLASMAVMPFAVNWINNDSSSYLKESIVIAESIAVSTALNSIIKYSISRPRPYIYSGKASEKEESNRDAHLSFYSGHSSFAFATAISFSTVMSNRFDETWQKSLIWGIPLTLAFTVAFLRVQAGKHFLTDVFTGAVIGGSIGWLVPYLHEKSAGNIIAGGNSNGFMFSYSGNF